VIALPQSGFVKPLSFRSDVFLPVEKVVHWRIPLISFEGANANTAPLNDETLAARWNARVF
jgi:hypothetical protein